MLMPLLRYLFRRTAHMRESGPNWHYINSSNYQRAFRLFILRISTSASRKYGVIVRNAIIVLIAYKAVRFKYAYVSKWLGKYRVQKASAHIEIVSSAPSRYSILFTADISENRIVSKALLCFRCFSFLGIGLF